MKAKRYLNTVVLVLMVIIYGFLTQCKSKNNYPNILLIMTDQQPVSCVGVYNDAVKTPNLEQLANQGVTFDRFYISGFACSPSRACILTGRYPHNHGVVKNDVLLDPTIPTLGTIFRDAGYKTGYFGKGHLGGDMYPDRYKDPVPESFTGYWHFKTRTTPDGWKLEKVEGGPGEDFPQLGFSEWAGG